MIKEIIAESNWGTETLNPRHYSDSFPNPTLNCVRDQLTSFPMSLAFKRSSHDQLTSFPVLLAFKRSYRSQHFTFSLNSQTPSHRRATSTPSKLDRPAVEDQHDVPPPYDYESDPENPCVPMCRPLVVAEPVRTHLVLRSWLRWRPNWVWSTLAPTSVNPLWLCDARRVSRCRSIPSSPSPSVDELQRWELAYPFILFKSKS
jgi:hypothetical protein